MPWDLLLAIEREARKIAGFILATKSVGLQTVYIGTQKTKVTIHWDIAVDHLGTFIAQYGLVGDVSSIGSRAALPLEISSSKWYPPAGTLWTCPTRSSAKGGRSTPSLKEGEPMAVSVASLDICLGRVQNETRYRIRNQHLSQLVMASDKAPRNVAIGQEWEEVVKKWAKAASLFFRSPAGCSNQAVTEQGEAGV